jgi:hypothetical protein
MTLTDGDKAECKEIAREIIKEVLSEHILLCPHGRYIAKLMFVSIGIALGSGVTGGGIVLAVMKAVGIL